jgi:hypothetical protein
MINDHTTGLLKYRFNGIPCSARNAVRHWPHGFDIADVQRRHVPSVRVAADGVEIGARRLRGNGRIIVHQRRLMQRQRPKDNSNFARAILMQKLMAS